MADRLVFAAYLQHLVNNAFYLAIYVVTEAENWALSDNGQLS